MILELLSAFRALSIFFIFPDLLVNLALLAMLNNVPVVSKKLTNKNEIIIPIIATSRAPKISNFINTGKKSGGADKIPLNSIKLNAIARKVITKIPIIIDPEILRTDRIEINKNPSTAIIAVGCERSPRVTNVELLAIIIPPLFKPIKPIKSPTPEPMAILKFKGMPSNIHLRKGVILISVNKIPAQKTAPRATSHE